MIKMTNEGKFFLHNQGRRPVFINGSPVIAGSSMQLQNNSALEVDIYLRVWSFCNVNLLLSTIIILVSILFQLNSLFYDLMIS